MSSPTLSCGAVRLTWWPTRQQVQLPGLETAFAHYPFGRDITNVFFVNAKIRWESARLSVLTDRIAKDGLLLKAGKKLEPVGGMDPQIEAQRAGEERENLVPVVGHSVPSRTQGSPAGLSTLQERLHCHHAFTQRTPKVSRSFRLIAIVAAPHREDSTFDLQLPPPI